MNGLGALQEGSAAIANWKTEPMSEPSAEEAMHSPGAFAVLGALSLLLLAMPDIVASNFANASAKGSTWEGARNISSPHLSTTGHVNSD